ncbi:MAG: N-methyl-L-tryptophan oxidase, partial [Chloroflexi bacterium]|nr:N-methyl-L-tryptophan oxidase [Chloroflexota bacterium]
FEAPAYVPLVLRAYELWRQLEAESGRPLLTITGGLMVGGPETALVSGALASARQHGLPHEHLLAKAVNARFPAFDLPDHLEAVYEPDAGFLRPEACVDAHLTVAEKHGTELHESEPVRSWSADDAAVEVTTDRGRYTAERLVLTPGPWAPQLLAGLGLPLTVQRIVNVHFQPRAADDRFAAGRCPVYLWEVAEGVYYGFPELPGEGVKFGRHDAGTPTSADTIERQVAPEEVEALRTTLDRYMPGAGGSTLSTLTCMYTVTPDWHFILDRYPSAERVVFGCGFSGHGFKFASAIGEALAELLVDGEASQPIAFLGMNRFADRALAR